MPVGRVGVGLVRVEVRVTRPLKARQLGMRSGMARQPYALVGSDCRRLGENPGSRSRFMNTLAMNGRSSSTAASFSTIEAIVRIWSSDQCRVLSRVSVPLGFSWVSLAKRLSSSDFMRVTT